LHLLKAVAADTNGVRGESKPVLISIKNPLNSVIAKDDSFIIPQSSPAVTLTVLANDTPTSGLRISQLLQFHGNLGTAAIAYGGSSITYTPFQKMYGTERFAYTVTNSSGSSDSAWVTVRILSKPFV